MGGEEKTARPKKNKTFGGKIQMAEIGQGRSLGKQILSIEWT